jgi:hypothetical protein
MKTKILSIGVVFILLAGLVLAGCDTGTGTSPGKKLRITGLNDFPGDEIEVALTSNKNALWPSGIYNDVVAGGYGAIVKGTATIELRKLIDDGNNSYHHGERWTSSGSYYIALAREENTDNFVWKHITHSTISFSSDTTTVDWSQFWPGYE